MYHGTRHVELDGVGGEQQHAQRGIIPGCSFAATVLQLLLLGALREVRAAHPTVSIRVVVDDLSLQRFGDLNRAAQELEQALAQAGCEVAMKKSRVLRTRSPCGRSCSCWGCMLMCQTLRGSIVSGGILTWCSLCMVMKWIPVGVSFQQLDPCRQLKELSCGRGLFWHSRRWMLFTLASTISMVVRHVGRLLDGVEVSRLFELENDGDLLALVRATETKNWRIDGEKKRITRKEYQRLLNNFEMEGLMARKGLWNLEKEKIMRDRGELPNEEGDAVREYKAMHEENFWSSWLREDERGKERRMAKAEMNEVEKGEKRKGEEEKEENETGTVKRKCEGCVSVEAFEIFSQEGYLESWGDLSWVD